MSKCKITVLRREYYQDLADQYLADPQVGKCPLFKEGQEFIWSVVMAKMIFGI